WVETSASTSPSNGRQASDAAEPEAPDPARRASRSGAEGPRGTGTVEDEEGAPPSLGGAPSRIWRRDVRIVGRVAERTAIRRSGFCRSTEQRAAYWQSAVRSFGEVRLDAASRDAD